MSFFAVLAAIGVLAVGTIAFLVTRMLKICGPNEVLIFSGKTRVMGERRLGYIAIKGGRRIKVPLLEKVDKLDLTNMVVNVAVSGAFSKGGIPLNVDGVANVKIAGEEPMLANAVERFLGKPRDQIMQIAKETLEGNLRGVLATMTPQEVNTDKITFAQKLMDEADHDLHKLGLMLDTLKIQNVSDERGYLDCIGRTSGAEIRKQANIAEAESHASSVVQDASNKRETELVRIESAILTLRASTKRKVADAESQQAALIAVSRGEVQAAVVEATAMLEVQQARIEQAKEQLEADVITPARAEMAAAIDRARGDAATILEQGKATAEALAAVARTWKAAGPAARDVFLMQKLQGLVETLTRTVLGVKVDKITVLGAGGGADLAPKVVSAVEQLNAALGVDVVGALKGHMDLDKS